jgi:hypothetical protein
MSGMIPARMPLHIDMRSGIRIDLSRGSHMRAYLQFNGPIVRALRPDLFVRVIKEALLIGGEYWRTHWMPLRFTAQSAVIVHNSARWDKLKAWAAHRALPQFVGLTPLRGGKTDGRWYQRNKAKMIINVFATARTSYMSKGPNAGSAIVRMSYGHGIRPEKAHAFKTIAPLEWDNMQRLMVEYLSEQFAGTQSYNVKRVGMLSKSANAAMRSVAGIDYNKLRRSTPQRIGLKLGANASVLRRAYMTRATSSRIGGGV